MEHPRNFSPLQKTLKTSIRPCDRLHVTINLQKDSADDLWLPGMSVFSVNGPPLPVAQTGAQPEAACSNYAMSTNLPIRPRVAPDHRSMFHGNGLTEEISPEVVTAYMRQSGASEDSISRAYSSPALLDYNRQMMLLHQQNQQRLGMARTQLPAASEAFAPARHAKSSALQDYNTQLRLLEQQNKKRLIMARQEHDVHNPVQTDLSPSSNERKVQRELSPEPNSSSTVEASGSNNPPAHQRWLSGLHALQDYQSQMLLTDQQTKSQGQALSPRAMQNYQMQIMLLEQQNRRRMTRQHAAKAKEDADLAHKSHRSNLETQFHERQLAAERFQPESYTRRYPPAQEQAIIRNAQKHQQIFCPCCRQRSTKCDEGRPTCQICVRHNLPCHDWTKNHITSVGAPIGDKSVPDQRWDHNGAEISLSAANSDSPPTPLIAEQIAAQKQALILRHQKNMEAWQRIQQQKHHSPHFTENAPSPSPNNNANQWPKDTCGFHNGRGGLMETNATKDQFVVDLPMRPSKQVAEQADCPMDEWSEVERPQDRACSEESEQFIEDFSQDFSI